VQSHPTGSGVTLEKLKLLADYVCVQPLAVSAKNAGGELYIPETASARERSQRGVVLVVGPGDWREDGMARVAPELGVGDLVFFGKYSGTEEELGGRTVLVMRETECRMRVSAGDFVVIEHDDPKLNHLVEDFCEICHKPEADAAAGRLAAMRQELVDAGHKVRARRPCAWTWPATPGVIEAVPCTYMQTLSEDGTEWVGERCGHTHPNSLSL
jgi:chaperonin GroES